MLIELKGKHFLGEQIGRYPAILKALKESFGEVSEVQFSDDILINGEKHTLKMSRQLYKQHQNRVLFCTMDEKVCSVEILSEKPVDVYHSLFMFSGR
jgi:hypothetical protein